MLNNKVEQRNLYNIMDYNALWENAVSRILEDTYSSATAFKSAYMSNSKKVFDKINSKMKVVPIDLKETLSAFYSAMITDTSDDGPRRGVA